MGKTKRQSSEGLYSAELEEIRGGWEKLVPDVDVSPLPFFARLSILGKLCEAFSEDSLRPFGVTWAEYQTLGILRSTGKGRLYSPTELAAWAHQTTAGMTKTLDRLERAGLARRRPHPTDRRRVEILLTEKGVAVTDRMFRAHIEAQQALLEGVGAEKRRQFNRIIEELVQRFAVKTGRAE